MKVYDTFFDVLYEDNHLIAVNKRSGVLVQGDNTGDTPLAEIVKSYLKEKYQKPGNVFAGVIHRLDRPVSGIVLIAKTSKALERMNEMFRTRAIEKTYWAVVKNKPPLPKQNLVHFLKKLSDKNISRAYDKEIEGGLRSELSYELIAQSERFYLLEVKPVTGRHHQIRTQLSKIGCPIKGDVKYGFDRTNEDGSIHLHARKISFIHPIKKEPLEIVAQVPEEKIWSFFKKLDITTKNI